MTAKDAWELTKNLAGAIGAGLAALESWTPLLPLNPVIRVDYLPVACIFAVLAGGGAHQGARRRGLSGWWFLVAAAAMLLIIIAGGIGGLDAVSAVGVSILVKAAYVGFFAAIGAAFGAFAA